MIVKLKKNSSLHNEWLYELEPVMGECFGHGCGFGGEDIDWLVSKGKGWGTHLSICHSPKGLEISFNKYYDDDTDTEHLPLSQLPEKWQSKLLKVLKQHTFKRSIPSVT